MSAPEDLLERIRLRLDESFAGIGEVVAELQPADVADLVNQLTRQEAAAVLSLLSVPRAIEVCDQPTLRRRSAILEQIEPGRAAQILEGLSADERTEIVRGMGDYSRRRLLPKLSAEVRADVEKQLQYPPHAAGGIMTTEFVRLDADLDRRREPEAHPLGGAREGVDLRLLRAASRRPASCSARCRCATWSWPSCEQPVEKVMRRKPVTVSALDDQEARGREDREVQPARGAGAREGRQRGRLRDGRRRDRRHDRGGHRGRAADGRDRARRARRALLRRARSGAWSRSARSGCWCCS